MKTFLLILITICILFVCIFLTSCGTSTNDFEKGKRQLEQQGYTNVENIGYNMFCCDEKDIFSTGFKCKNSKGEVVEGCFCSTMVKSVTIRFE